MKNENSRFKVVTLENGVEVLLERYIHEDSKAPAINISFFVATDSLSIKVTLSKSFTGDDAEADRDDDWDTIDVHALAKNFYDQGVKMIDEMIAQRVDDDEDESEDDDGE